MAVSVHFLSLLCLVVMVCGEGQLDLLLVSYQNPSHTLYSGLCCDMVSLVQCASDPCDNTFTLCLLPHSRHSDTAAAYIKEAEYKKLVCPNGWESVSLGLVSWNSDNISFPSEGKWINQYKGLSNPITLDGDQWQDGFKLLVLVGDFDMSRQELVNVLFDKWSEEELTDSFPPPRAVTSVKTRGPESVRAVSLTVSARVRHTDIKSEQAIDESSKSHEKPSSIPDQTTTVVESTTTGDIATEEPTEDTTMVEPDEQTFTEEHATMGEPVAEPVTREPAEQVQLNETIVDAKQGLSRNTGQSRMVGVAVGGAIGSLVLIVVAVLVGVACMGCLKRKRREDQFRLTGERTESEVTALYRGPTDNPNYTGVMPNTTPSNSYQFSNSLYGALSQESLSRDPRAGSHDNHMTSPPRAGSHDSHMTSPPRAGSHDSHMTSPPRAGSHDSHMTSPPLREPVESEYSEIRREHLSESGVEDSGPYSNVTEPIQAGYSVISREHMENDGYSVVTRDNMVDDGYSVVTRDNMVDDGYSVVTREYLEEASDSGSEAEQEPTSKLLTTDQ